MIFKNKRRSGGFTLIELLVVISIISLLSSVLLPSLSQARKKALISKDLQEMVQLGNALELYKDKTGKYIGEEEWEGIYTDPANIYDFLSYSNIDGSQEMESAFNPLVTNGFISSIPGFYKWPDNGLDYHVEYIVNPRTFIGDIFYYEDTSHTCGGKKVDNYMFLIYYGGEVGLNLPKLARVYRSPGSEIIVESSSEYCFGN